MNSQKIEFLNKILENDPITFTIQPTKKLRPAQHRYLLEDMVIDTWEEDEEGNLSITIVKADKQ